MTSPTVNQQLLGFSPRPQCLPSAWPWPPPLSLLRTATQTPFSPSSLPTTARPPKCRCSAAAPIVRALSTAAAAADSRPRWAMIHHTELVLSPSLRASFELAEPPCASRLRVPVHLVDPQLCPLGTRRVLMCRARAASGDGLLVLDFADGFVHGSSVPTTIDLKKLNPDVTRFVCNPLSGELFRIPDIDWTKKTFKWQNVGILTQSDRPNAPPGRYALASFGTDDDGEEEKGTFAVRLFLSQKGQWDKLAGLPCPLPLRRQLYLSQDVVTFAGRLWWVDVTWGAVTVGPFSNRPELCFVELPRGSVTEPVVDEQLRLGIGRYRRMGVSEGRLRYVEVSQKEPFVLNSVVLDDDSVGCWTLEHRVGLNKLPVDGGLPWQEDDTPRIGVIDPLNASIMHPHNRRALCLR